MVVMHYAAVTRTPIHQNHGCPLVPQFAQLHVYIEDILTEADLCLQQHFAGVHILFVHSQLHNHRATIYIYFKLNLHPYSDGKFDRLR